MAALVERILSAEISNIIKYHEVSKKKQSVDSVDLRISSGEENEVQNNVLSQNEEHVADINTEHNYGSSKNIVRKRTPNASAINTKKGSHS